MTREPIRYDPASMWDDGFGSDTEAIYRRERDMEDERRIDAAWERFCEEREAENASD